MEVALPIMMLATAVGAGITAYGQYEQGQAAKNQYTYQAGSALQFAAAEDQRAQYQEASGVVARQQTGLEYRAARERGVVTAAAGNLDPYSGSPLGVQKSQLALGREEQNLATARAEEAAYGSRLQAASYRAGAAGQQFAAVQAPIAGDISALGTVVSGAGSVAGKWYDYSKTTQPIGSGVSTT